MSIEETKVKVQLIKDPETISLIEAAKVAITTELAHRKIDDSGISVSAVLYRQAALISKELTSKFVSKQLEVNHTAIKLEFERSLTEAEECFRDCKELGNKLPRCWSQAKSDLGAFIELGGDFNKHATVSSCKNWKNQENKRRKETAAMDALKQIAADGEHVKDTGKGGAANIEKSESTQVSTKVQPIVDAVSELDEQVQSLLIELAEAAIGVHPDKAIKMLTHTKNQLIAAVAKKVINQ